MKTKRRKRVRSPAARLGSSAMDAVSQAGQQGADSANQATKQAARDAEQTEQETRTRRRGSGLSS